MYLIIKIIMDWLIEFLYKPEYMLDLKWYQFYFLVDVFMLWKIVEGAYIWEFILSIVSFYIYIIEFIFIILESDIVHLLGE